MRPSPTTHYRFLASGVDFSCASCSAFGGEAHARLAVNAALGKATVRECSIMEDARLDAELPAAFADGDPSVARTAQGAMLSLHPFQLATLRVSCGSDGGNTDGNESRSLR